MDHDFSYPATLIPDRDAGGFVVTFVDFPEAITQGDDVPDALAQAADALEEAMAGRLRRGEPIASPSSPAPGQHLVAVPAQTAAKAALRLAMVESGVDEARLAARLACDEKEIRRLLDPRQAAPLSRIEHALAALGRRIAVRLVEGRAA